jgi:hypothetical protein
MSHGLRNQEVSQQIIPWERENIPGFHRDLGALLELFLVREDTLGCKLLDLIPSVLIPVLDVGVLPHAEGSASVNESSDSILETSAQHKLLVLLWCTSLDGSDKTSANPDSLSTPSKVGSKSTTIVDSTGTDNVDGLTVELGFLVLADVNTGRDEDGSRDVASVSSTLTGLGTDDVAASVDCLLDVLGVANHVHDGDPGSMELVNSELGGNANSRDEDTGALLNDDVDEFRKLTLGVVVLYTSVQLSHSIFDPVLTYVGLASAAANLRKQEVDTKRCLGILQVLLDGLDLGIGLSMFRRITPELRVARTCWRRIFGV